VESFKIGSHIPPQGVLVWGQDFVNLINIRGVVVRHWLSLVLIGVIIPLPHSLNVLPTLLLHLLLPTLKSVMLGDLSNLLTDDAAEDSDELLHPPGVPVEPFYGQLATAFHIVDGDLQANCRYSLVGLRLSLVPWEAAEGDTSEEHLFDREGLFIDCSSQLCIHLDYLELLAAANMREPLEDVTRGQSERHIQLQGGHLPLLHLKVVLLLIHWLVRGARVQDRGRLWLHGLMLVLILRGRILALFSRWRSILVILSIPKVLKQDIRETPYCEVVMV
jgi:hypothetical protein